jgi:hypothetical protein
MKIPLHPKLFWRLVWSAPGGFDPEPCTPCANMKQAQLPLLGVL